jgi:hypothetical protein
MKPNPNLHVQLFWMWVYKGRGPLGHESLLLGIHQNRYLRCQTSLLQSSPRRHLLPLSITHPLNPQLSHRSSPNLLPFTPRSHASKRSTTRQAAQDSTSCWNHSKPPPYPTISSPVSLFLRLRHNAMHVTVKPVHTAITLHPLPGRYARACSNTSISALRARRDFCVAALLLRDSSALVGGQCCVRNVRGMDVWFLRSGYAVGVYLVCLRGWAGVVGDLELGGSWWWWGFGWSGVECMRW